MLGCAGDRSEKIESKTVQLSSSFRHIIPITPSLGASLIPRPRHWIFLDFRLERLVVRSSSHRGEL